MPTVFSIAAKLLGVLLIYRGLYYLLTAFMLAEGPRAVVHVHLAHTAMAFGFAFVLLFRTDHLARRIGVVPDAPAPILGLEPAALLRTGIVLIGLYVFVTRIAVALGVVSMHLGGTGFGGAGGAPVRILIEFVPVVLALFLVFRPDRVAAVVMPERAAAV